MRRETLDNAALRPLARADSGTAIVRARSAPEENPRGRTPSPSPRLAQNDHRNDKDDSAFDSAVAVWKRLVDVMQASWSGDQDSGDHKVSEYLSAPRVNDAAAAPSEQLNNTVAAAGVEGPLVSPRLQRPAHEQHYRALAALRSLLSAQELHRTTVVEQEHGQTHDAHLVEMRLRQGRVRRLRALKMASSYDA